MKYLYFNFVAKVLFNDIFQLLAFVTDSEAETLNFHKEEIILISVLGVALDKKHRMIWVERYLKDHLIPTLMPWAGIP